MSGSFPPAMGGVRLLEPNVVNVCPRQC